MKKHLRNLNDGISTKLLKETIDIVGTPLTHIINRSFDTGIVPSQLKTAKVIPIFKANDSNLLKNYRPVSLLPAISKLLEKIMHNKLVSFLTTNNTLYEHQYGFRSKHSTVHPIIHLLNKCAMATNANEPEYTLAVLCDLSKAFDVIDHKILLYKLRQYGIRGVVIKWFESYLKDRNQFVNFENNDSDKRNILCGVPQGSILGPLLYLIYVNDIFMACDSTILSYADDTTMVSSHPNLKQLYLNANSLVDKLYTWFCANKLSLNAGKTKYIVIRPKHKKCNLDHLILSINGIPLQRIGEGCSETSTKFLGIYLDESLSWKAHISHINKKISRALFAIKQIKHVFPYEILQTLYHALIFPHIEYGIIAWGSASSSILRATSMLQKRAIRSINKSAYNSHTEPLFKSSNIMKIEDVYKYKMALFMFDFSHGRLPLSFDSMFKFTHEIQNYRVTRQSHKIYIPRCKGEFVRKLPYHTLPSAWNIWSELICSDITRNKFKHKLKSTFIDTYLNIVKCSNKQCKDCRA